MGDDQMKVEVDWCIAQLEQKLSAMDPYSRPAQEAAKVHRILVSSKAPVVKKRQAMRNMFGDYRAKMKASEKKSQAAMKKSTLVAVKDAPSESKFLRRSNATDDQKARVTENGDSTSATPNPAGSSQSAGCENDNAEKLQTSEDFKFGFTGNESVETGSGTAGSDSRMGEKNYFVIKPTSEDFKFNFPSAKGEET